MSVRNPSPAARHRAGPSFINRRAACEAIKSEWRVEEVRLSGRQGVRIGPARSWGRFEPAVAPAAIEIEIFDGRFANDRRTITAHIGHSAPRPYYP